MTDVSQEELSALIDGELDPARAAIVRAAIHADPELAAQFQGLNALDEALRMTATEAAFSPVFTLPATTEAAAISWRWPASIAAILMLVVVRLLPKLIELPLLGLMAQLLVLGTVIVVVMRMARETDLTQGKRTPV